MELSPTVSLSIAMSLVSTFLLRTIARFGSSRGRRKALEPPPGPWEWPVFRSLGALVGALPPHRTLAALAARHGALMHLRLGSFDAVVASSADAARLVLKTHDAAFVDRARTTAGETMMYGYRGIVHTPYGAYWRMARKLCATELFSPHRVDSYEHIHAEEMQALVRDLLGRAGHAFAVRERLVNATLRNILCMSVGDKWSGFYGSSDGEQFRRTLDEAFEVTGVVSNVGEWIPLLGWLDVQGCCRRMKRLGKLYDRFLEQILQEHEVKAAAGDGRSGVCDCDLVDVLLHLSEEESSVHSEARLTRDGVKAFIQDIIAGGTESSAMTVEWAIAELLRRPDAISAATDELNRVVGRTHWVTERDLPDLPYIDAVVKETMRLHSLPPQREEVSKPSFLCVMLARTWCGYI